MDREVTSVLASLVTKGCHVNETWLTDCVNFYRSENQEYTLQTLEAFAFDQWLLADLRDMGGVSSFPPNLVNQLSTTLNGRMACQVEYLTDIGHSSYSQMQKIRNEDVGNLVIGDESREFQQAWEPKTNRVLSLSICDGVQTVRAMEYKAIPKIKTDLIPGTKVLIVGPVQSRRGVLLLEDKNIVILGGEVEALVISNAYENILARKLNLPENPDPYKSVNVTEAPAPPPQPARTPAPQQPQVLRPPLPQQPPALRQPFLQQPPTLRQPASRPPVPSQPPSNSSNQQRKLIQPTLSWVKPNSKPPHQKLALQQLTANKHKVNSTQLHERVTPMNVERWEGEEELERNMANMDDMDFNEHEEAAYVQNVEFEMKSDEEDVFLELEANFSSEGILNSNAPSDSHQFQHINKKVQEAVLPPSASVRKEVATERLLSTMKRPASEDLQQSPLRKPLFHKQQKQETSSQEVTSTSDAKNNLDIWESDDWFKIDDASFQSTPAVNDEFPKKVASSPFVYLSQIINFKSISKVVFRAKAAVITVVEKLRIMNAEWHLSVKITDGSANMTVKFSSKVLEEIIGMSASDMQQMKREMNEQPSKKEFVRKKLEQAQKCLISLNCFMDIEISPEDDVTPVVRGLENLSPRAISALKARRLDI